MIRQIIKIDEDLCNGCGICIPNCHEGALQIIDGKARLISDLMCDGLGACIGYCPEGAITIEERVAEPYDEIAVIKGMIPKGKNTIIAHLQHLLDYNEHGFFKQGFNYLFEHQESLPFDLNEVVAGLRKAQEDVRPQEAHEESACGCGSHEVNHSHAAETAPVSGACMGMTSKSFAKQENVSQTHGSLASELTHWPIQLHLINPAAQHFQNADLLIAADCSAFTLGGFHSEFLKGRKLVIACPKLDSGLDQYLEKIKALLTQSNVNTVTVVRMEVPCCFSLVNLVKAAREQSEVKTPIKEIVVGINGNILSNTWI